MRKFFILTLILLLLISISACASVPDQNGPAPESLGQGEALVGFYQTILDDLWNVDEGLNSEQGYIDKENLYFETGMLITIEISDVTEDSFTFDVTKWRSGTGAFFFIDCKAVKIGNGWSYTVGSEAIS